MGKLYQLPITCIVLLISACTTSELATRNVAEKSDSMLLIYRLHRGFRTSPQPIYTQDISRQDFEAIKKKQNFRSAAFRRQNFYNGCYLFRYRELHDSRVPADESQKDLVLCYRSRYDQFFVKGKQP